MKINRLRPGNFIDLSAGPASGCSRAMPRRNCVTRENRRIFQAPERRSYDRLERQRRSGVSDPFVGDIHQPLHAANDEDRGANCVPVDRAPAKKSSRGLGYHRRTRSRKYMTSIPAGPSRPHKLELTYAAERDAIPGLRRTRSRGNRINWRVSDIYGALHIPIEPCQPTINACLNPAGRPIETGLFLYESRNTLAGHQMAKAGFRLASLLNEIWTQPAGPTDATRATNPVLAPLLRRRIPSARLSAIDAARFTRGPVVRPTTRWRSRIACYSQAAKPLTKQGIGWSANCP